jgi:hypothetical protein
MIRNVIFSSLLAASLVACFDSGGNNNNTQPDASTPTPDSPQGGQVIRVNDNITSSTTWEARNTYVLPRLKQVFVEPGATLTIEAGTRIEGEQGSVLVITRGAKIMAQGTKEKPILFTSSQAVGMKAAGWWGGLLVLGAAPINQNKLSNPPSDEATFEAFTSAIPEGKFGGTDANDNSGVIKYVRIEFAGFNYVADREFNNFTLCGVGAGTTIDHVQVHGGSDDGVELFGGTVNLKHIVSSQNQDDGFDTDNGWNGKVQFLIVQNISHPATLPEASNGYESDNHGTAASYNALPRTEPTIYNATIIGDHAFTGVASFAGVFRRGTSGHYFNHIFYNFPKGPEFRDAETKAQLDQGKLEIKSSIFFNNDATVSNLPPAQSSNDIDESLYINTTNGDQINVDPGLTVDVMSKTAPNFKPMPPSMAIGGGATPPNDGFFDATATFIGAVGDEDWTLGWTSYPQN